MWTDYTEHLRLPPGTGLVYRLLNSRGDIIYIGQTRTPLAVRLKSHSTTQPWWDEVTAVFAREVPLKDLDRVEREQIKLWSPRHNVVHKPVSDGSLVQAALLITENRRMARVVRALPPAPKAPAPPPRETPAREPFTGPWVVDEEDPEFAALLSQEALEHEP